MGLMGWWSMLTALVTGCNSLAGYSSLIQAAFGANLAYAVLIRTGNLQGNRLTWFADRQHRYLTVAHGLLTSEVKGVIKIDGNKLRCENLVSEAKANLAKIVPWFAGASVLMAMITLAFLFALGAWGDTEISNWLMALVAIVLFLPIPAGLCWTHNIVKGCERLISGENSKFFTAVDQTPRMTAADVTAQFDSIRGQLKIKPPGIFKRIILGVRSDPEPTPIIAPTETSPRSPDSH